MRSIKRPSRYYIDAVVAPKIRAALKDAAGVRRNRVPAVAQGVRITGTSHSALMACPAVGRLRHHTPPKMSRQHTAVMPSARSSAAQQMMTEPLQDCDGQLDGALRR